MIRLPALMTHMQVGEVSMIQVTQGMCRLYTRSVTDDARRVLMEFVS